ncbi:uncharacterized protein A4U43_C05F20960 [Asparagus officinalis]|uniref:Uncharacterized protein n=1 Tax=Asparagus officinalis TaxID=4686 RepID=A0A5P1ETG1_ASPOF|nr:pentatricopeptide repeat-containing protein At3g24000, mitochondrial-like [Asparagus officinalis]ONK69256.1 uncharacterized protein A4U43_C05F20960 [Asparagus officinalis]
MFRFRALPNHGTVSCLLKTFSSSSFSFCLRLSLKVSLSSFPISSSALVHFYATNSLPDNVLKVFNEIRHRNEYSYAAANVGLAQNDRPIDAIRVFKINQNDRVPSTAYIVSGALCAAAHLATLQLTRVIHSHAIVTGTDYDIVAGTALIVVCGKSGVVIDAQKTFDWFIADSCLVTRTEMMGAYAPQGYVESARQHFDEIVFRKYFVPSECTFLVILTACSNAGQVDETTRLWLEI